MSAFNDRLKFSWLGWGLAAALVPAGEATETKSAGRKTDTGSGQKKSPPPSKKGSATTT